MAKLKPEIDSRTPLQKKADEARARHAKVEQLAPALPSGKTDEDLFLAEVGGARKLDEKGGRVLVRGEATTGTKKQRVASDDAEVLAELADLVAGEADFDFADSDEYVEGIAEGLDRRILKRLRGGEYAVQAHLDLHGLTRDEARDEVAKFILASRRAGRRCVLLVHGRGLHSKDSIPVLKVAVRSWLERGAIARAVLAFVTARPCDGGTGAVYVLLRR